MRKIILLAYFLSIHVRGNDFPLQNLSLLTEKPSIGIYYEKNLSYDQNSLYSWIHYKSNPWKNISFGLLGSAGEKKSSSTSKTDFLSLGFSYRSLSFYLGENINTKTRGGYLGLQLYKEKFIFLNFNQNPIHSSKEIGVGFQAGNDFIFGLNISKIYTEHADPEFSGSFRLGYQFDTISTGIIATSNHAEKEESAGTWFSVNLKREKTPLFENELDPIREEEEIPNPAPPVVTKQVRQEKKIRELSLQELLKLKVPLTDAIRINRASRNKTEYETLLKVLPKETVKKCNKLQFEKRDR